MPTILENYWTKSGRGDEEGDVEREDHQSSATLHDGKSQGKEEEYEQQDSLAGNTINLFCLVVHTVAYQPTVGINLSYLTRDAFPATFTAFAKRESTQVNNTVIHVCINNYNTINTINRISHFKHARMRTYHLCNIIYNTKFNLT